MLHHLSHVARVHVVRPMAVLARHCWRPIRDAVKDAALRALLMLEAITGSGPRNVPQRTDAGVRRVLVVDELLPDPLFGAGYPRAYAIVRSLVDAGCAVSFYPMQSRHRDLRRMEAAFRGRVRFRSGEGARGLRRLLWREGKGFDAIFVSRPGPMAAFRWTEWHPSGKGVASPVIYDAEAVLAPREARRRALFGEAWSDDRYRDAVAAELDHARDACAVTAVGQEDARVIAGLVEAPVFVLPHPVVVRTNAPSFADRRDLLFVGPLIGPRTRSPNVDSILWFATEVMPHLDALVGTGYRLHVAGQVGSAGIAALASDRIVLHGVVQDLRPLYDRCRLFVAPTRYAAGIPLKVVEAMGEGIPCAVTPLLAQQLGAHPDALATGEGAEGLARACADLYEDERAWSAMRNAGFGHVRDHCSAEAFDRVLKQVLDSVVDRSGQAAGPIYAAPSVR